MEELNRKRSLHEKSVLQRSERADQNMPIGIDHITEGELLKPHVPPENERF